MYGDTEVMRKHASRLREQADQIRSMADQIVAQAESVAWAGRAGDTMRERVRERAAHLREAAARHDAAARTLHAPLHAVEELKYSISENERRVRALLNDGALPAFEPPP